MASAPETPDTAITAASSSSYIESSEGVNETVPVVEPAEITISSIAPLPSV